MRFQVYLKARVTEGNVNVTNGLLNIKEASSVTLVLVANTSFNGFDKEPGTEGKDEELLCKSQLKSLEDKKNSPRFKNLSMDEKKETRRLIHEKRIALLEDFENWARPILEAVKTIKNDNRWMIIIFVAFVTISNSFSGTLSDFLSVIVTFTVFPSTTLKFSVDDNSISGSGFSFFVVKHPVARKSIAIIKTISFFIKIRP